MLPFGILWFLGGQFFAGRLCVNLYNSGIAALTVASCLQGVLKIYGTTSDYMPVYWLTGAVLTGLGILCFLVFLLSLRPGKSA